MIRVFIVDDHVIVREGVKRIIADTAQMKVTGEAGEGAEALKSILANDYDVILLDLNLPDMDGLEILRAVKVKKPALPVLVLSMYPEEDYAVRALKEGASGYLNKRSLPGELIRAIRMAVQKKTYISESFGERLVGEITGKREKQPHESLSSREYQIFSMIIRGKPIKQVADELFLAPTTVSSYRTRIMEKMNVKSNSELIRYAVEHNLID